MDMKKAGMIMSLLMGLSMSFLLTMIGLISARQFTFGAFLRSFAISFMVSTLIGLIIPVRKISAAILRKRSAKPQSLKARLLEALVTDICYSPLMTFIMISLAHRQAVAHGAKIPFGPMLLKAEVISFIAAFILNLLITPLFARMVMKNVRAD